MGESGGRARAGWECVRLGLVLGVCMCAGVGEGVRAVLAGVRGGSSPPSPCGVGVLGGASPSPVGGGGYRFPLGLGTFF